MVRIHMNFKYIDPFHLELDVDLEKWWNRLERQKPRKRGSSGEVAWIEIDFLKWQEFLMLTQFEDWKVEGFRAFIKIAETDLDTLTPEYLPNRTVKNWDNTDPDNPLELPNTYRTWREWTLQHINNGRPSYPLDIIEGFAYIPTQAGGVDLSNSELVLLKDNIVGSKPVIEDEII